MRTEELRRTYLEFFQELDHKVYASAPLVPANDPSLLFTVAGMVQFKDALLGVTTPEVPRAASCQVCMRAGGKHNDLDNVGYTARHNTLFEMLGNFSFGDYFKEEAIEWAWGFVIEVLNFDRELIWITTHPSDVEARKIWVEKIGIRPERVVTHEDNFWEMGNTGPCGPNTEIFYDQGSAFQGGPPGSDDEDGDRFLEFWNLVFPQFDRQPDGELAPLAAPGVDTGLGLERTAALVQGVASNYEIDLFRDLVLAISRLVHTGNKTEVMNSPSIRVIADHIRSCAFLIGDGVLPSNEGRGYVLRRVIRRALRHGHKLGLTEAFFHRLVSPLVDSMGDAYPNFANSQSRIEEVLLNEEEKFAGTLRFGMSMLEREIENLPQPVLQGDLVFKLYDTYGFPVDLTQDIARERGLEMDSAGFEALMNEQRDRARSSGQFESNQGNSLRFDSEVEFEGYRSLAGTAVVMELFKGDPDHDENEPVDSLELGDKGLLVLDRTGFYGEAGGQVGDTGFIKTESSSFVVHDTQRTDRQFVHFGEVETGRLCKGDQVSTNVDSVRRQDIARNHTGTHLLHAALKNVLGPHVSQRGSLVAPDRLRFDFSHDLPLAQEEIERIEDSVNEQIALNTHVETQVVPYDEAVRMGAVALFGEKYGEIVRVLNVGNGFSVEFCGGTHVAFTGEIGSLRIISQSGIASGVRRIEALTGRAAQSQSRRDDRVLRNLENRLRTGRSTLGDRLEALLDENFALSKSLEESKKQKALNIGESVAKESTTVAGIQVVATRVDGDVKSLMSVYDDIRSRLKNYVIVLAVVVDERIHLVSGISKNLVQKMKAGELIEHVGSQIGARGGGKPEMARAGGGTNIAALPKALESVKDWVRERQSVETP
ncbi:MAG: alanine--tRNA ligase [Gammaproteobacteria bacterium]|nr:alanine--tRNA ligase [Gammaproteobacteria bacterium]MYD81066.1 alanine--tRNA ligase [Gammaproteobacteria bacterium]